MGGTLGPAGWWEHSSPRVLGRGLPWLTLPPPAPPGAKRQRKKNRSVFDEELTNTSRKALKRYRAG